MNNDEGTISLCMIVRDEERNLGRCLESVRGFVDEIIVVDTGSRDATPDIAGRYGAALYRFPWQDDFAQARNESLKYAIGEWVLVLDADEELPPETAQNLRHLASCREIEAWAFTIISHCPPSQGEQQIKHSSLRMFKNREDYCFEGKVHEQIRPSIIRTNPDAAIRHAEAATIIHHGYEQDTDRRREKTLRNITILKQALAERPADPFLNYNLGLSYYALGDLESSRQHYETARQLLDPRDGFAAAFFRNYAICLGDLGDYEQALNLADEGLACFPDYPDLYFIKGQLCCDLNMLPQASASFLKCLRFRQTLPEYITTEGVTGHLALENLAEVCAREQNFDQAGHYLEQVLRIRPTYALFTRLCSLLQQQGLDGSGVAAYLEDRFNLDHPVVARLLFDIKEFQACLDHLRGERREVGSGKSVSQVPGDNYSGGGDDPGIGDKSLLEAKCLLRLGRYAEAVKLLPCSAPQWPGSADLLEQCCLALWLQDPRQDAGALIAACGHPDDPAVIACWEINLLLFHCAAEALPGGAAAGCGIQSVTAHRPEVVEQMLRLALEALLNGDDNLALAASLAGCASRETGEAHFALGQYASRAGYSQEARQQLENACRAPHPTKLVPGMPATDIYYLLGTACANLNLHDQAFLYFAQAGIEEPGNELYAACALEQLASQCLLQITRLLALEEGRAELRHELFKVASLRHKSRRLQQDLLNAKSERQEVADAGPTGLEHDQTLSEPQATGLASPSRPPAAQLSGPQVELSIVMPVWTGPEVTQKALRAITACTDRPYELIIIDNGSDAGCKAVIAEFANQRQEIVRVISNESNQGYPLACNQGLGISKGSYAVVMNNDILVTPHWASRMMAAFADDPRIGVVGPRTNYIFGEQVVGECHYDEATLAEWSQQWYGRHAGSRQPALRLVGFLMMIRRELIEQIGGFDPVFGLGNYEDDDYCLRARLAGYRLVIANDVFVHHYGSQSFKKQPEAYSRLLETNRRLFASKWGLELDFGPETTISGVFGPNELYIPLG